MARVRFHQELDQLKDRILAMAGMAEQAIDVAVQAYRQRDLALCERVLANESAINRVEREVDEFAIDLLAMQQPMARDLRFILAVIKINADLERVGDQAVNIVQRVMNMIQLPASDIGETAFSDIAFTIHSRGFILSEWQSTLEQVGRQLPQNTLAVILTRATGNGAKHTRILGVMEASVSSCVCPREAVSRGIPPGKHSMSNGRSGQAKRKNLSRARASTALRSHAASATTAST